jgi:hypothetical protein
MAFGLQQRRGRFPEVGLVVDDQHRGHDAIVSDTRGAAIVAGHNVGGGRDLVGLRRCWTTLREPARWPGWRATRIWGVRSSPAAGYRTHSWPPSAT